MLISFLILSDILSVGNKSYQYITFNSRWYAPHYNIKDNNVHVFAVESDIHWNYWFESDNIGSFLNGVPAVFSSCLPSHCTAHPLCGRMLCRTSSPHSSSPTYHILRWFIVKAGECLSIVWVGRGWKTLISNLGHLQLTKCSFNASLYWIFETFTFCVAVGKQSYFAFIWL